MAWRPICRALGWLLLPLGQDALSAYVLHLFVVALAAKVKPLLADTRFDDPTHNSLFQMAGIAMIWAIIMVRPMIVSRLQIGIQRAAALWAAGPTHLPSAATLARSCEWLRGRLKAGCTLGRSTGNPDAGTQVARHKDETSDLTQAPDFLS